MSGTLKASVVQDGASATANLTLDSSGNVTAGNNLTVTKALIAGSSAGTTGQVLTSAGSGNTPTWTTPSVGAMTLISTQTASGSAVSFTGLSGYNKYQIIFDNLNLATASNNIQLLVGTGSGPTYITSNYNNNTWYVNGSTVTNINNSSNSNLILARAQTVTTGPFSGSYILTGFTTSSYLTATGNYYATTTGAGSFSGNVNTGAVVTALQIYNLSYNFSSGTISLYGISS
jgi:hypothetical protein